MCDNIQLNTIKQCPSPLNTLYFSRFNEDLLQRGIRQKFKQMTGIKIDYQNADDLRTLMRYVFVNNSGDHYNNVNEQVKNMNTIVIDTAVSQVKTGVAQYLAYVQDIDTIATPLAQPINTSTYGKKIDLNTKIGFGDE
jgi:ActR/RegA family two-component response regulator